MKPRYYIMSNQSHFQGNVECYICMSREVYDENQHRFYFGKRSDKPLTNTNLVERLNTKLPKMGL